MEFRRFAPKITQRSLNFGINISSVVIFRIYNTNKCQISIFVEFFEEYRLLIRKADDFSRFLFCRLEIPKNGIDAS